MSLTAGLRKLWQLKPGEKCRIGTTRAKFVVILSKKAEEMGITIDAKHWEAMDEVYEWEPDSIEEFGEYSP